MASFLNNQSRKWRALRNPDMYHGWGKSRNYFEGWYYKLVDPQGAASLAFIPGISMDRHGNRSAFIQVLDGLEARSDFHAFPAEAFIPDPVKFHIEVGNNAFSKEFIRLDLPGYRGEVRFREPVPWPANNYGPGVMGWYSFVPFMQCYHGVVSMGHSLEGGLDTGKGFIPFSGGRGYIEKDWGRSFPKAWIWMQTNHFVDAPGTSIMFSIAHIPWLTGAFIGFLGGFLWNGKVHDFTTYNRSAIRITLKGHGVHIRLKKGRLQLDIDAEQAPGAELKSPVSGEMLGKVNESMKACIHVRFSKNEEVLFEGTGTHAGMEMAGDIDILLAV